MKKEIWKDVEGYENCYQVSNSGRVRSKDRTILYTNGITVPYRGMVLRQKDNGNGYLYVNLSMNNKSKSFGVHRLVAMAFLRKDRFKDHVNHINSNKYDNRSENLEWCTPAENSKHAVQNKLLPTSPVIQRDRNGKIISSFDSISESSRLTGVNEKNISACCAGSIKAAGGYIWHYNGDAFDVNNHKLEYSSGSDHYSARAVVRVDSRGEEVEYSTIRLAAKAMNVSGTAILRACKGIAKTSCGYKWRYK